MVAFQRLIGEHGPAPALLERDAFVASSVPEDPVVADQRRVPAEGAPLDPTSTRSRASTNTSPSGARGSTPATPTDAQALDDRGLVLDSRPS